MLRAAPVPHVAHPDTDLSTSARVALDSASPPTAKSNRYKSGGYVGRPVCGSCSAAYISVKSRVYCRSPSGSCDFREKLERHLTAYLHYYRGGQGPSNLCRIDKPALTRGRSWVYSRHIARESPLGSLDMLWCCY